MLMVRILERNGALLVRYIALLGALCQATGTLIYLKGFAILLNQFLAVRFSKASVAKFRQHDNLVKRGYTGIGSVNS